MAIQPDGKMVAVGWTYVGAGGSPDFALARYNTDGSLDRSFSGDGKQTTDFGGNGDAAYAVAIDRDGKIVVVGATGGNFAVARYNADGSLDETFADDGKLTTDFGGYAGASGVAIDPDGKIVAVGSAFYDTYDFALARYNPDGSLDAGFSGDGKQTTEFGGDDVASGVALQPDGKIVVVGYALAGFDSDSMFTLARYNPDGSLDSGFAAGGVQLTDFGWNDGASSVALQLDGKIVAVGYGDFAFALARYNVNGSLDASFSEDGKQTTSFEASSFGCRDGASGVAIQPDGKIVVVGSDGCDFALARYDSDGWLDATFSGDGKQTTDFGSTGDVASGVAIDPNDPDGKIVVVGRTFNDGTGGDFTLARYQGGSGSPDTTPPETTITGGPTGTTSSTAIFSFDSSATGSTFACSVDASAFFTCNSPHTISTLTDGPHSFEVRATDTTGNVDPSPAGRGFSVDTVAPETTVTSGPSGTTNSNTPTFTFDSSEGDSTFACRHDDSALTPCSSPYTTSPLSTGSHTFEVRATDSAGNMDPTPASRGWTIVSDYPQVVLVTPRLVSYWRLGETSGTIAADAMGANNGSYRNGVLLDRPSALHNDSNASASFDGWDDFVSVADSVSLEIEDSFTLEAWVKRSGTSTSTKTVLSKGNGSFRLSFVNNVLTLTKNNSGTIVKASVPTTDTTGFHHIVATKSGTAVKLCIDGVDQTGTVTNRTIANTSWVLNIGRNTTGSEYFAGLIDEVAIYDVALSVAQVQQHFKASGR